MKLNLVTSRSGFEWVRQGIRAFFAQPMAFFSLFMLFTTALAIASALPVIGSGLGLALVPSMTLALMVATEKVWQAREQEAGLAKPTTGAVFIAALGAVRDRIRPLLVLGLLYAMAVLAVIWLASLFDDPTQKPLILDDGTPNLEVMQSRAFQMAIWLRLALYAPVSLLFWHAPALVHWYGVAPVKSLFFSIVACFRNIAAMTVFGLVWIGVSLGASALLGLVGTLALTLAPAGAAGIGASVILGGSLALTAMFFCTNWFTFRDSFSAN